MTETSDGTARAPAIAVEAVYVAWAGLIVGLLGATLSAADAEESLSRWWLAAAVAGSALAWATMKRLRVRAAGHPRLGAVRLGGALAAAAVFISAGLWFAGTSAMYDEAVGLLGGVMLAASLGKAALRAARGAAAWPSGVAVVDLGVALLWCAVGDLSMVVYGAWIAFVLGALWCLITVMARRAPSL